MPKVSSVLVNSVEWTVSSTNERPPSRQGKRIISFYVDPAAQKQLNQIALNLDTSSQALMVEALNDFFIKRGYPPIAS